MHILTSTLGLTGNGKSLAKAIPDVSSAIRSQSPESHGGTITAELGSAFLDASAGVAWVEEAFGPRMGGLCGYLGWISGATDNAIYPVRLNAIFSIITLRSLLSNTAPRHYFWSTLQALQDGTKMNFEASIDLYLLRQ